MKLQEKYRPITQRVLNPNANSFVGSRKISIPSVGPRLQNGVLLLIKFKVTKKIGLPFRRCGKMGNGLQASQGGELSFSRKKKGNNKLPLHVMNPSPTLYKKNLGLGFPKHLGLQN